MARFRGTVQGGRGKASRLGHSTTGLRLHANSWNGNVEVFMQMNMLGDDVVTVWFRPNEGPVRVLYNGPIHKYVDPRGTQIPITTDEDYTQEQTNEQ